jgi:hypothetical protein
MFNENHIRDAHQYVFIQNEEYRELVKAKRDADCLKAILLQQKESYGGMKHEQLEMICTMFGLKEEGDGE